jgi:hypothetical protein
LSINIIYSQSSINHAGLNKSRIASERSEACLKLANYTIINRPVKKKRPLD